LSLIRLSDRMSKFMMVFAATWAFGLAFLILANIIGRSIFDSPVYGTAEIVSTSIVIIVFLQVGYAIRSRSMLRADFLIIHLPELVQRIFLVIGYLLGAAFFLMIITGGWEESILSYIEDEFEGEGALRVPSWPARWIVLIGSALALINYIVLAYIDLFKPKSLVSEIE
jgi:TRAP-type C4-dicarboxylate transport system permease small subunit